MDKYKQVLIDYAQNRKDLALVKKKITALNFDENGVYLNISLSKFRSDWLDNHEEYDAEPQWDCWVSAVSMGEHEPHEMELAKLLDEKKEINAKAGQIKRNMCAYGRSLANEKQRK